MGTKSALSRILGDWYQNVPQDVTFTIKYYNFYILYAIHILELLCDDSYEIELPNLNVRLFCIHVTKEFSVHENYHEGVRPPGVPYKQYACMSTSNDLM